MKKISENIQFLRSNTPGEFERVRFVHLINMRSKPFQNPFSFEIPDSLKVLWMEIDNAKIFFDEGDEQWGLSLLSERQSFSLTQKLRGESQEDFLKTDIIIGQFVGEEEFLIVSCAKENYGFIIVSNPILKRQDWSVVSPELESFLNEFIESQGEKFWE